MPRSSASEPPRPSAPRRGSGRRAALLAGTALLAPLLAACGGQDDVVRSATTSTGTPPAAAPAAAPADPARDQLATVLAGLQTGIRALQDDPAVRTAGADVAARQAEMQAARSAARAALKETYATRDRDDTACGTIDDRRDEVAAQVQRTLDAADGTTAAGQALAAGAAVMLERLGPLQAQAEQARTLVASDPLRIGELTTYVTSLQGLTALRSSSATTAEQALAAAADAAAKSPDLRDQADRVVDTCLRRAARG